MGSVCSTLWKKNKSTCSNTMTQLPNQTEMRLNPFIYSNKNVHEWFRIQMAFKNATDPNKSSCALLHTTLTSDSLHVFSALLKEYRAVEDRQKHKKENDSLIQVKEYLQFDHAVEIISALTIEYQQNRLPKYSFRVWAIACFIMSENLDRDILPQYDTIQNMKNISLDHIINAKSICLKLYKGPVCWSSIIRANVTMVLTNKSNYPNKEEIIHQVFCAWRIYLEKTHHPTLSNHALHPKTIKDISINMCKQYIA